MYLWLNYFGDMNKLKMKSNIKKSLHSAQNATFKQIKCLVFFERNKITVLKSSKQEQPVPVQIAQNIVVKSESF